MIYALMTRDRLELNVLHDRNPQYVLLSDGSIRNGYTLKLLNMLPERRSVTLGIEGLPDAGMFTEANETSEATALTVPLEPDRTTMLRVFVRQPAARVEDGERQFRFVATVPGGGEQATYRATFNAPESHQ